MTNKSLLLISALALSVIAAAVLLAGRVLVGSFDAIEAQQTAAKAEQVLRAFEADLNQLAISNRDYAEWDAAAQFVIDRDQSFVQSNLTYETMDGMHVDMEWILDASGAPLHSGYIDKVTATMQAPAPDSMLAPIRPYLSDIHALRARSASQRIVNTPNGLLAFSAVEIARTDKSHGTGAILLFARFIDDKVLERVRRTSDLPVTLTAAPAATLPASAQAIAADDARIRVAVSGDDEITGYATVHDAANQPVAVFATVASRNTGALGRRITWTLMTVLIVLLLAAGVGITMLLTRLQRSGMAHAAAVRRHHSIIGQVGEGIVLAEPASGEIIEANDAFGRLLGYTPDRLSQAPLRDVFLDLPAYDELLSLDNGALRECRLRGGDGHLVDAEITVSTVVDGGVQLLCIVTRDLKLRRQLERQERENQRKLARLSHTDALTGLPNRGYLHARLPKLLQSMAGRDRLLAVLFVDLDQFKNINESRGHARGDELIKVVAKRLRAAIAADDLLVRMGGDEFVVVTPMMPNQGAIASVAKRLMGVVHEPITLQDAAATVTASIGIGVYPSDGLDMESLLKHADIALYQAKAKGRNVHCFFSSDMNVQLSEHVALEQSLRRAFGTDQLFVELQPVIDVFSGTLTSFEALVRWRHPEQGLIPPLKFIPVAEKCGLIDQLGDEVLRMVVRQQCDWQREQVPLAPVAINVSPMQFERTDFSVRVHELCLEHELDPKWLHFEVTESSWLQESNKHIVSLDILRSQGSRVSIDDFGTGFSNLGYLKQLPVDTLKIDRSFVSNITVDQSDAAIVKSIIGMARNLNLDVVAEGVETAEQLAALREMGCQKAQGYYFSKPIAVHLCRALLMQMGEARKLTETVKARAFKVG